MSKTKTLSVTWTKELDDNLHIIKKASAPFQPTASEIIRIAVQQLAEHLYKKKDSNS